MRHPVIVWLIGVLSVLTAYVAYCTKFPSVGLLSSLTDVPFFAPSPVEVQAPSDFSRRIVAVGDLHGDFPNALKVLKMTGVVDAKGDWTGHVDWFVQTGDIIDRGDDTIKIFTWMDQLREQAHAAGGEVISLLGNHEWMNMIGDWRYVDASEIATFGSVAQRQAALTTGKIGQAWLYNYSTAARVPLHPSLGPINTPYPPHPASPSSSSASPFSHAALSFVHGGLAPGYKSLVPYPTKINSVAHSLLKKLYARKPQPPPSPPAPYRGLPPSATAEEHELYDGDGPLWYRGWALEDEKRVCRDVDVVLEKIGVRRLIMGHTPDFVHIVSRCQGKVIIIDTGISHAYGGALSALSIDYSVTQSKNDKKSWKEREIVKAIYLDKEETLADDERTVIL